MFPAGAQRRLWGCILRCWVTVGQNFDQEKGKSRDTGDSSHTGDTLQGPRDDSKPTGAPGCPESLLGMLRLSWQRKE